LKKKFKDYIFNGLIYETLDSRSILRITTTAVATTTLTQHLSQCPSSRGGSGNSSKLREEEKQLQLMGLTVEFLWHLKM
jgi:hypothetical protein